jgi:hypothetical protein
MNLHIPCAIARADCLGSLDGAITRYRRVGLGHVNLGGFQVTRGAGFQGAP